jgi:hypothetical protein
MVAALPASAADSVLEDLHRMFPCVIKGGHVLEAAFNNPNPIVHPPGSLLNTGRIQYSGGDFYMYREGITEAVARVIREVYEESRRRAQSLGFDMLEYRGDDFNSTTSIMGVEFVAPFDTRGVIASILGPCTIEDRYITEDLPMGLVPRSELGRLAEEAVGVFSDVEKAFSALESHIGKATEIAGAMNLKTVTAGLDNGHAPMELVSRVLANHLLFRLGRAVPGPISDIPAVHHTWRRPLPELGRETLGRFGPPEWQTEEKPAVSAAAGA